MGQIPISNIVNVSVSQANLGANEYNTSNLGLFSDEVPADTFGTAGWKAYVDSISVATDFGSSSKTAQMANSVFSQKPNILQGNGQLIVILMGVATEQLALSGVPASGAFAIEYNGNTTASLPYTSTAAEIQSALQLLPGLGGVTVSGSLDSQTISIKMSGVYGEAPDAFTISSNTLQTSAPAAITIAVTTPTAGESINDAIVASESLVNYFGIIATETVTDMGSDDVVAAATTVQSLNKIAFWVSYQEEDIQSGGVLYDFMTGTQNQNRGLYYGDDSVVTHYAGLNALTFMAGYAGRGLSVNFSGSNTTITMNLKQIINSQPDPSMSQTVFNEAKAAGADIYPSIQGDAAVISNGANGFFDNVYNQLWFVGAIQIAGFNYLAQADTKIPQNEEGMYGLKSAYRNVCNQAVTNGYLSPGTWTSPTTFGDQNLFYQNISQQGFYIYSQPIAQQSQANRANRQAPLVQIAIKLAGAIQSSDVIIFVNP